MENINEMLKKKFSPMITEWEFTWSTEQGSTHAHDTLVYFGEKLYLGEENSVAVSENGKIHIKGVVFGHQEYWDGSEIITSPIVSIERVDWKPDRDTWTSGKYSPDEITAFASKEVFCANTKSGNKYYFIKDNASTFMYRYLAAALRRPIA